MTLVLELTQDEEAQLQEKAARQGQGASAYALELVRQDIRTGTSDPPKKHNAMEFYGVGREALRGLDVDAYIREMRDEWDQPRDEN